MVIIDSYILPSCLGAQNHFLKTCEQDGYIAARILEQCYAQHSFGYEGDSEVTGFCETLKRGISECHVERHCILCHSKGESTGSEFLQSHSGSEQQMFLQGTNDAGGAVYLAQLGHIDRHCRSSIGFSK